MANNNYADFSEIYKSLNTIGKNANRASAQSVNQATEYAKRKLVVNTPYWKGKKYKNDKRTNSTNYRQYDKYHAKHHVVTTKATTSKHNTEVGYDSEVAWKIHFVELGTIKQRPQGFIARTIDEVEPKVSDIILKAMKEAFVK